jgi:cytidylate kinase
MKNIICITGELGSGKSTAGKIIAKRLNYEFYSTGAAFREIADKLGVTVYDLNIMAETDDSIDRAIDSKLVEMGHTSDKIVVDSRMAWFFMKDSFKVRLTADINESARRVLKEGRKGCESYKTLEEAAEGLRERRNAEVIRYKEKYGADLIKNDNYHVVIDTTSISPEECAEKIIDAYNLYLTTFQKESASSS